MTVLNLYSLDCNLLLTMKETGSLTLRGETWLKHAHKMLIMFVEPWLAGISPVGMTALSFLEHLMDK
jgi:hypothetical protein